MNINEIQKIVSGLTEDEFETLKIEQNLFHKDTGLSDFNKYVRSNVKSKNGVYILFDPVEIKPIYIGMAASAHRCIDDATETRTATAPLSVPMASCYQRRRFHRMPRNFCAPTCGGHNGKPTRYHRDHHRQHDHHGLRLRCPRRR